MNSHKNLVYVLINNVDIKLTKQRSIRNKDDDHVMLNLYRERQGRITSINHQGC